MGKGYTEVISGFRVLDKAELPEGVIMGPDYETFTFNPPVYPVFAVQIEVPVRGEFCKGATKLSQRNDFTRPQWHHYR